MRAARTDSNHREVIDTLRQLGAVVLDLSAVGRGVADAVVLIGKHVVFVEIKTARGKLTPEQEKWHQEGWPVRVIRSVDEAIQMVQAMKD
jgi:Holliday junction resolvase